MDLSLHALIQIGRKWWWLLLLAPILAAGSAFYTLSRQTPMYAASSMVEINPPSMNADTFSYYDTNIVATYRTYITTSQVLDPFIEANNLPYTDAQLRAKVSTVPVTDTRLMKITVTDSNPKVAADLANGVANQFATFAQERTQALTSPYKRALESQIADTQANIKTTQQLIEDLTTGDKATAPETAIQIRTLQDQLDSYQSTYQGLLVTANQMELESAGVQTSVRLAQKASPPSVPFSPKTKLYTLLGAFAGLCIAIGAVALFTYFDNTIKAETDVVELTGAPMLTAIQSIPHLLPGPEQLFVIKKPTGTTAESIRLLRTNVEFAAASREIASLVITSAGPGEGKSTVTANLGAAMAQSGFTTVIVDADLRRPSQHKIFGVRNERGLTTLLTHPEQHWKSAAVAVLDESLFLLPSGPLPPNPADILSSDRFRDLLEQINTQVDIVLVDTPPVLAVSDPLIVSPATDGVLLVCKANSTRIDALARAAAAFPESVRRIGVVLNQQEGRGGNGYYYYGYYGQDETKPPAGGVPSRRFGDRFSSKSALDSSAATTSDAD